MGDVGRWLIAALVVWSVGAAGVGKLGQGVRPAAKSGARSLPDVAAELIAALVAGSPPVMRGGRYQGRSGCGGHDAARRTTVGWGLQPVVDLVDLSAMAAPRHIRQVPG